MRFKVCAIGSVKAESRGTGAKKGSSMALREKKAGENVLQAMAEVYMWNE